MTQPRKHRHSDMIRRWLDDDSLEVEWLTSLGKWESEPDPDWDEGTELRFKPKMIKCGELEFPEPMRVAPILGGKYWLPSLTRFNSCTENTWDGEDMEKRWFASGLLHTTQAAAEQHAHALIALTEM